MHLSVISAYIYLTAEGEAQSEANREKITLCKQGNEHENTKRPVEYRGKCGLHGKEITSFSLFFIVSFSFSYLNVFQSTLAQQSGATIKPRIAFPCFAFALPVQHLYDW